LQQPLHIGTLRVSALRFADPRVLAVLEALCGFAHLPAGFRHRDLRPRIAALLGRPYSRSQMTYDLRRLRLRGLIERRSRTHAYVLTPYGRRVAFFYSKLYLRILRPQAPVLARQTDGLPPSIASVRRLPLLLKNLTQPAQQFPAGAGSRSQQSITIHVLPRLSGCC
jgi:hypothetical protein